MSIVYQVVDVGTQTLELRRPGVLVIRIRPGDDTVETARRLVETARELTGGQPTPYLLDTRNASPPSAEVREVYTSAFPMIKARALLVGNAFSRIAVNVFTRLTPRPFPSRVFTDEDAAFTWLSQYAHG